MTTADLGKPTPEEYPPYVEAYIAQVPAPFTIAGMEASFGESAGLLRALPGSDAAAMRTAPDKWSVAEIVGHISDCERILSYRLLRIARGDQTPLPGFDQDAYVAAGPHAEWSLEELLAEWLTVRTATVSLLKGLPADAWKRTGTASGQPISVRALAAFILGHERHHMQILRQHFLPER